jgi:short chain dehydrogenase
MGKLSHAKRPSSEAAFAAEAEATAKKERDIQRKIDRSDKQKKGGKEEGGAMQAGARPYPVPPLPGQHLKKPGQEVELELPPLYDAPHYKGSDKLLDKVALITGGDSGIGRSVAVLFAREGADVAITYLDEHDDAEETKRAVEKEGRRCILLSGEWPIQSSVSTRWAGLWMNSAAWTSSSTTPPSKSTSTASRS